MSTNLSARVGQLNPNWNEDGSKPVRNDLFAEAMELTGREFRAALHKLTGASARDSTDSDADARPDARRRDCCAAARRCRLLCTATRHELQTGVYRGSPPHQAD